MTTEFWIVFTSLAILMAGSLMHKIGRAEGYDEGWLEGYNDGYENGISDGKHGVLVNKEEEHEEEKEHLSV